MEKLKNGAEVIAKERTKDDDGFVVLAKQEKSWETEYITWITDEEMNCYHGNYSRSLIIASNDYVQRVKNYCN